MFDRVGGRFKLRTKLTLSFLAVALVLTSIDTWSTRWLERRWEKDAARRTEMVYAVEDLASVGSSAFEEGFGYVLSSEEDEKGACIDKLDRFDALRQKLLLQHDLWPEEAHVLRGLGESVARAKAAAWRLFESYETQRRANPEALEGYEIAMDRLTDGVGKLATHVRARSARDNLSARRHLDHVLLVIAGIVALLGISIGAGFGVRLTKPLFRLRDAALRVGAGDFDLAVEPTSSDEIGELTAAFGDMARNLRRLLGAVAEQKKHLENVFASLGEMLLVCDLQGRVTEANRAACASLGYQADELMGRQFDSFVASTSFKELLDADDGSDASAKVHGDHQFVKKDAGRLTVSLSTSRLRGASHGDAGVICVARDVSEQRNIEAELRQGQKLEAIGRLASGIAHEINTPTQFVSDSVTFAREASQELLDIIAKYQAVLEALQTGKDVQSALAVVHEAERQADLSYLVARLPRALDRALEGLSRIGTIVRSMKIFAHPDQRQMTPVDLNRAVMSTLDVARHEYKTVAELQTDFGELPPVTCHAGEINQAVLNLVVNAAHAIADHVSGGAKGTIRVQTRLDGKSAVISISDTGGGIPDEFRHRIFDPFFTTKEVGRGTGQGLTVARSVIVEKHRGQLNFTTEHGKGTTFEIRLPLGSP